MKFKLAAGSVSALLLLFALYARAAPARKQSADFTLTAQGLQADAKILERAYETLHPGLLRYNTEPQMQARFASLQQALDHDQSRASAYLTLSEFAATIKCGHTYANFYNQSKAVQSELFERSNRVPFYFRWIDGQMIVTRNFSSDRRLTPGSEILSIDDVPAADILKQLMRVARADGSNDAKRIAYLQVQGEDKYEAFDIFLPLFFPQVGSVQRLRVRGLDGKTWSTTVPALTYAQRIADMPASSKSDGNPWTLTFPGPSVALLTMPTWEMYNRKWDWHAYLERVFKTVIDRKTGALVIDLRGNEGGDDVGNLIAAHLIRHDLPLAAYLRLVRYRSVPRDLLPYLDTWDTSFRNWGNAAKPYDKRFYRLVRYDDDANGTVISALAPRFKGHVFVIIGPTNSSATFQFAQFVKAEHLAVLVGRPTGGNLRGINGGAFFFLRLPYSGLEMDLPLIGTFPVSKQPDAGVYPDVDVAPTRVDVAQGRDPELLEALSLATAANAVRSSRTPPNQAQTHSGTPAYHSTLDFTP